MAVLIENPILNSPFERPGGYYKFDEDGNTDEVVTGRRRSSYFIPIAAPKKKTKQLTFDTEWTADRAKENDDINFIRSRVDLWREQSYPGITPVTRSLLEYWTRSDRERRLFFCQVEALETLIFLTEAAPKGSDAGILNKLADALAAAGTPPPRQACKMATGSGKTVVMAMVVAWQTLNKRRAKADLPTETENAPIVGASAVEGMDEVKAYVKNQNLGFKVPYTYEGRPGNYYPDYILRIDDGRGTDDLLNLVVEITGQDLQDKEAKVDTAAKLWAPAVNAEGTFRRWGFLEITDPWSAHSALRVYMRAAGFTPAGISQ
jgi:type III restriction enzyme